jgi:ketosteroid isomerase-like protein
VDVGDRTSELAALSLDAAVALEGGPELTFYFSCFTSITPRKVIKRSALFPLLKFNRQFPPVIMAVSKLVLRQSLPCFRSRIALGFAEYSKLARNVPVRLRTLFRIIAAVCAASVLYSVAQDSGKTRVLALENAWNEAESHRDVNALAGLIAPTFVYTDADGSFMDKQQFLASIRASGASQIVNEGMKMESYGDVIVVTGSYREQGSERGKSYSRRGRFTDTWVEKDGQWLCVASQETLIPH